MGSTFSVAEVAAVMDCPATQLLGQIREASEAGVTVSQLDDLAFRHPLVRAILDDSIPSSARQALHLQIARALSSGTSPERAARHLLAAGSAGGRSCRGWRVRPTIWPCGHLPWPQTC